MFPSRRLHSNSSMKINRKIANTMTNVIYCTREIKAKIQKYFLAIQQQDKLLPYIIKA